MTIENVLAAGYLPAVFVSGRWILGKLIAPDALKLGTTGNFAISCVIGLACWFPLLAGSAWVGKFDPIWIGGLGWLVFIAAFWTQKVSTSKFDIKSGAVFLFAGATFVWNFQYANESMQGGRDQGAYSIHGINIAKTGDLRAEPPYKDLFTTEGFHLARGTQAAGYFFDHDAKKIGFQFSPAYALHLAQGFGIGGYAGLFAVNPLLSGLNVLLFFTLLRQFISYRWSLAGVAFFALNVVQFWNSRITLSEILAQSFIFAGLLLVTVSIRNKSASGFAIGCSLLALNSIVRIDGFLVLIGIGAASTLLLLGSEDDKYATLRKSLIPGSLLAIAFSIIAVAFNKFASPVYFESLASKVYAMTAVGSVAIAFPLFPFSHRIRSGFRIFLSHKSLFATLAVLLAGAFLFSYFIRPNLEPFAVYPEGHNLAGVREFKENMLVDLAAYISPIAAFLAAAGAILMLRPTLKGDDHAPTILLTTWLLFALLYLYNPLISPDHIWRMRRFTPMVIPGFIAFAAFFASWLFAKIPSVKFERIAFVVLALLAIGHLINTGRVLAFAKLHDGFAQFIEDVRESIPEDSLVVAYVDITLLGPLHLGGNHEMIRPDPNRPDNFDQVISIAKREKAAGREVYVLANTLRQSRDTKNKGKIFRVETIDTKRRHSPLPIELRNATFQVGLFPVNDEILGYDREDPRLEIGPTKILGIEESGLSGQEYESQIPFRWTEKMTTFSIPWIFSRDPIAYRIRISATKPGGSNVTLKVNERVVYSDFVPEKGADIELPLDQVSWDVDQMNLVLEADPWKPSDFVEGSQDTRELGVRLSGIVFLFERDDRVDDSPFGSKPTYGIKESGFHPGEIMGDQSFRWTDGNARFEFELEPDFTPEYAHIQVQRVNPDQGSDLQIVWNEKVLFNEVVVEAPKTITLDITEVAKNPMVELQLISNSFIPSKQYPTSTDSRKLGVMIGEIKLAKKNPISDSPFGNKPTYGVEESGFYGVESTKGQQYRWTDGNAVLEFDIDPEFTPRQIEIEVRRVSPKGSDLQVIWNESEIYPTKTVSANQTVTIDLDNLPQSGRIKLELVSSFFVPSEQNAGNNDNRKLGIMIGEIKLIGQFNK